MVHAGIPEAAAGLKPHAAGARNHRGRRIRMPGTPAAASGSLWPGAPGKRNGEIVMPIVAGGGIGGLAAALALLRAGADVRVYEQASALGEVGAGLTLSRGAMRCCVALGIDQAVRAWAAPAGAFAFLHYRTGEVLARTPPPATAAEEQDVHIYRADFHRILADAVCAHGGGRIVLGHRLASVSQNAGGVTAHFTNGEQASGEFLIAADGVRSAVRAQLFGEGLPAFTGRIAYRFMLPAELGRAFLDPGGRGCLFVGRGRVFNRYLVSQDRLLNCVALMRSDEWTADGWQTPAPVSELLAAYEGWHPSVLSLIERAPPSHLIKWGIFARAPRDCWVHGRVALLGDAAHPMQPFLGLGAAMAVEDATILGRCVAEAPDMDAALAAYERVRVPRANRVMTLSKWQGDVFDTTDPADFPPRGAPALDPSIGTFEPEESVLF
jgi:salicylate hydroxylase